MKNISELRQDLVSGDWVVIATGRARRPHEFLKEQRKTFKQPPKSCPFEKLHGNALVVYSNDFNHKDGPRQARRSYKSPHLPAVLHTYTGVGAGYSGGWGDKWWVQVVPNKYPAFGKGGVCALFHRMGPYQWTEGVGFHEVVVSADHTRSIGEMSDQEVELVMRAYQDRYLAMKGNGCVEYISIFHNHGREAGASISHPHSQIIAIPVIPPDFSRSLKGAASYYRGHQGCIHCLELRYELRSQKRVVYENENFVAIAPYASKTAFEIRVFPKKHSSHFEEIRPRERWALANALRSSLAKLRLGLKNPDYNFFLHTAPTADSKDFRYYHWHFEILPKTAIWAGFEIGTGIEISALSPEAAAGFLRKIKV